MAEGANIRRQETDAERTLRCEAATTCGLGSCPVCCVTIGGVHMMMLDAGFTATQIHTEHQQGYPNILGEILGHAV